MALFRHSVSFSGSHAPAVQTSKRLVLEACPQTISMATGPGLNTNIEFQTHLIRIDLQHGFLDKK